MEMPYEPTLRRIIREELGGREMRDNANEEKAADIVVVEDSQKVSTKYLLRFFLVIYIYFAKT